MVGDDDNATNPPPVLPTPQTPHTPSTIKLPILKKGVSTEDANQKFFRSLPSSRSQVDEFDLEEMDLRWQVAMISTRLKKFYKKTGRKLHFDAKEPVGFDKTKFERSDAGNIGYKARDNGRRPKKQDEHKAMVTIDGKGVDWTGLAEDNTKNYALVAFNSSNSGSDTEVTSCSKVCEESYAKLKKLYDEQREQLGVATIEIQAYTPALKKIKFSSQAASTSTIRKINTGRPIVNEIRPRNNVYKSHSPIRRPFNRTTAPKAKFSNHKITTARDNTVSAIGGNRETAVKTSADCNWRSKRYYWNKVSKYNSRSKSRKRVDIKDPLGRLKSEMAWVHKRN
nr:ribonuclease H-like domain-containing protein [Tanacetum cinerariifolium]